MESNPKYFRFTRQTVGVLTSIKVVLDSLAVTSVSGGAISTIQTYLAGARIALILPIVTGTVAAVSLALRVLISHIVSVSDISNALPIVVSVPTPAPELDTPTPDGRPPQPPQL